MESKGQNKHINIMDKGTTSSQKLFVAGTGDNNEQNSIKDSKRITIIGDNRSQINTYLLWDMEVSPNEQFIVTRGFDGCLFVFDDSSYMRFVKSIMILPKDSIEKRILSRFLISGSIKINLYDIEQIELPLYLIKHAKIASEAVIEGQGGFATIWSRDQWKKGHFPDGLNSIEKRIAKIIIS